MKTHWTERSTADYLFRIAADFVAQLEDKMESLNVSQKDLAEKLKITKGRVSQVFNHPGNITLGNIARYVRALGIKASIVAYDDGDPHNKKGPINSDIFRICWERCGKPRDFWAAQEHTLGATKDFFTVCNVPEQVYIVEQLNFTLDVPTPLVTFGLHDVVIASSFYHSRSPLTPIVTIHGHTPLPLGPNVSGPATPLIN